MANFIVRKDYKRSLWHVLREGRKSTIEYTNCQTLALNCAKKYCKKTGGGTVKVVLITSKRQKTTLQQIELNG